jgi:hypothetical protein
MIERTLEEVRICQEEIAEEQSANKKLFLEISQAKEPSLITRNNRLTISCDECWKFIDNSWEPVDWLEWHYCGKLLEDLIRYRYSIIRGDYQGILGYIILNHDNEFFVFDKNINKAICLAWLKEFNIQLSGK